MPPPLPSRSSSDVDPSHADTPCPPAHSTRHSTPTAESAVISTHQREQATPGASTIQTVVPQWSPINIHDTQGNIPSPGPSISKLTYQARAGIKRLTGKELEHYGTSLSSTPQSQVAEEVNKLVTNVSSKPERAKIMTQEIADSTIPVIWDTVSDEQLWDSHGVKLSEQRKLRHENQLIEQWGDDWKSVLDPQGTLFPQQLSEHLLKKLTQIPKFWTADQVHQALRYQVKLRANIGRRGVRTTLLLMPEDVSQATEKLATLSGANDDDVIEITAEEFDATFPLRQRSSTRFGRDIEVAKATTKLAPQHQRVAGSGRQPGRTSKLDKGKGRAVDSLVEDSRDSEENDEEVHAEIPDDEDGSDIQDPNADQSVLAGDESGRQNEDIQDKEGITEDDQNQEEHDHSPLLSPNSEPEPREIDDADHGIMAAPNPLLDQSLLTSGQLDHHGDTAMMDAGLLAATSTARAAESESTGSVSVDLEHKVSTLRNVLMSTIPENILLRNSHKPRPPVASEYGTTWRNHLQQLGFSPGVGLLPIAIPGLTTCFPDVLLLQWKRELDMHHRYAPVNPILYIAARTVPPLQFRNVNQEWDLEDVEMYLKQTVIWEALSDNDYVPGEAIAVVAGRGSPDRWEQQVVAALEGVSLGLATGLNRSGPDSSGLVGSALTWQEVETQPVMICPMQVPLRISQVPQPKTLRYIDLHYIASKGKELEFKWLGTHDSVSSLHCNQDIPPCLPSGHAIPGAEGSMERLPFSVELRGIWAVGDAILGLRSWDSPVVLEELGQLDDVGFVEDVLNRIRLRAMECYEKLEEWKSLQESDIIHTSHKDYPFLELESLELESYHGKIYDPQTLSISRFGSEKSFSYCQMISRFRSRKS
ncbi:hypothetical protein L873DRAFT_1793355 [Choiromyces venosus 120613-1]|uniref:Uncharacterized protein n=1 Tax=Choiromyces venosus 120613-1 TaxID=1336337 RepID=A0A3N4JB94_9PEZI|nr:hypothetical protein L873DRAFT_1793355 [Choiromyces venosus 120613-1]